MRFGLLILVGGCGFQGPFTSLTPGADSGGLVVDGSRDPAPDAPIVEAVDAEIAIDARMIDAQVHDAFVAAPDANPWPCGTEPAAPGTSVTFGNTTTGMTATAIGVNATQRLVAAAGATVTMKLTYMLHDKACAMCVDQIEYGLVQGTTGNRIGCVFDQTLTNQAANGNVTQTLTLPSAPGEYDLRLAQGENYGCTYQGASNWYAGSPPAANQTIAIICVH